MIYVIAAKLRRRPHRDCARPRLAPFANRKLSPARTLTPLGALGRGIAAGLVGNAAMDATQTLVYGSVARRSGARKSWKEAPAPAKIGNASGEGVFNEEAPAERISLFNNLVHWTYGPALAGGYGIAAGSFRQLHPMRAGIAFGTAVWVFGRRHTRWAAVGVPAEVSSACRSGAWRCLRRARP